MKFGISQQQLDKITFDFDGQRYYGVLQHWYPLFWQRLAGCGPACATNLLACIDHNTKLVTKQDCILAMRAMWKHVTPGLRGLNKVENFAKGCDNFFAEHKLPYKCNYVKIDPKKPDHFDKMIGFFKHAFELNQPVAFLNLSNGEIKDLERWHWVTIVGIEQIDDDFVATVFDSDFKFDMSLKLWFNTATNPAGFACFESCNSLKTKD